MMSILTNSIHIISRKVKMIYTKIKILSAIVFVIVIIGIASMIAGNVPSARNTPVSENGAVMKNEAIETVKFGWTVGSPENTNIAEIANELGYFEGIKVEVIEVSASPTDVLAAVSSGQIDAAHLQYAATVRAIGKGAKVKSIGTAHGAASTVNYHAFVMADNSIKSAEDLKGKKIGGMVIPGTTSYFGFVEYLKKAGLSINDVEIVNIRVGQEEQVLRSRQVDVVGIWDDFRIGALKDSRDVRVLFSVYDVLPKGLHHCGVIVSDKFIKERPYAARKFMEGFAKAADWSRENPNASIDLQAKIAKKKGGDPQLVLKYKNPEDIRSHALIEPIDSQYFIEKYVESGELKEGQLKASDIYTNEFNPYNKG